MSQLDEMQLKALLIGGFPAVIGHYFGGDDVKVEWAQLPEGIAGQADIENKVIYLSPNQSTDQGGFRLGHGIGPFVYRRKPKLMEGEQYFLTLLHEIGHLKVKWKPPRRFLKAKEMVEKQYPNDKKMQAYDVASFLKWRKSDTDEKWQGAISDLEVWVATGLSLSGHIDVDMWALREFHRNRRQIRDILKDCLGEQVYSQLKKAAVEKLVRAR